MIKIIFVSGSQFGKTAYLNQRDNYFFPKALNKEKYTMCSIVHKNTKKYQKILVNNT